MDERGSILIVDDDEDICRTLTLIFRKKGYKADVAATGQEAIEKAQGRSFNLVLLDIRLPDMEGVNLIAPLKEMHSDMEVIMVTAYASLETAVEALNQGASGYITKPLNMDEVLATVREIFEKQRLVREKQRVEEELRKYREHLEELVKERTAELRMANEQLQQEITEHKQAVETLRESEEKFRTLAEHSPNMVFINKKGKVVYTNEKCEEIMGYKRDEFYSPDFDFLRLIASESIELVKSNFERHMRSEEVGPFEFTLITKDGKRIEVIISTRLINYEQEKAILAILTDITQRKRAEEALRKSEGQLRAIFEAASNVSLIMTDLAGTEAHILEFSAGAERILGYSREEVIGKPVAMFHLPEDVAKFPEVIETMHQRKVGFTGESILVRKSGEKFPALFTTYPIFDAKGNMIATLGVSIDITQRKRAEEALEKAHLELSTLWQLSKEILSKESLSEIINRSYETIQNFFPHAHIFLSLLDAKRENIFPLEKLSLSSKIVDEQRHFKPSDSLIDWLRSIKESRIFKKDPSIVLDRFLHSYPLWYAFPMVSESGCIGCVIIAFDKEKDVPKSDLAFVDTLLSQIAGPVSQAISMEGKIEAFKERAFAHTSFYRLVGQSKVMQDIYDLIRDVAPTNATALITGENGTGKELAAMAIHEGSPRRNGPFVVANCSAYPLTLLESELFGHEKGAFTGAIRTKKGRFELANNGTIFLDEIGELPSSTQLLLLRVLQNRCFERIGGEKTINVDVRVITATNKDLKREIAAGRFREDLYYRLNVVSIHMLPLREKKEDIPLLCDYFLKKFCEETGKEVKGFTPQAMRSLIDYDWPGNVRELENVIQQAIILAKRDTIGKEVLPSSIKGFRRMPVSLAEHEKQFILRVLKECNLNKHEAARRLKISRATLYSKIKRYDLEKIVTFRFEAPQAKSVYLVGSFSQWDATAMPMKKEESGIWKTNIKLAPGTYEYRFYVDGNWQNDPAAEIIENPFGTVNNVLVLK